ncbi:DNA polymerase I [Nitrosomonas cryotolerans]|uniref:DNA polymerase I n=1 Tax=Nitrosomonas cryotolerans ATCC 49181 TaxID=1131553 RepID=A0A1N6I1C7_9PROT|nr:DNA polymerase I [Nitrosomonas cryotolerans]SFP58422.1 DNA polymerase I [Nitrosomonas cryotolerans]SIO25749.1 DNA polymerase I [Nitrosomonas cryotolerans ATCC 49181]
MKTLLLVDGSSYLYRAFHALPDLRNRQNEPTGAIHGVLNMLRRLHKDYYADYSACVFDAKGKTFRDDLYPEYKAHRPPMPNDLVAQIEPLYDCIRAMGWPMLIINDVEADDVIGTLAKRAVHEKMRCIISTGDKDIAQLVNPQVTLVNTMNNEILDEANVLTKFGVAPERILDYLTLVGDSADNIPGVAKVGPKTAVKWLAHYGTLDNIIAHADEIKGVVGNNLREALDWLNLSRKLLTIKCDVALPVDVHDLEIKSQDTEKLIALYERLDMKTALRELKRHMGLAQPIMSDMGENGNKGNVENQAAKESDNVLFVSTSPAIYQTILTESELNDWLVRLNAATLVSIDTETTSLNPMQAQLVGLSFCIEASHGAYLPLMHSYTGAPQQLAIDFALKKLKPWLEDATKPKLGQNLKYDQHIFSNHGIHLKGIVHDTLLQSYILESHHPHNMDSLALRHLNVNTISYDEITGKGVNRIGFDQVAIESATRYAGEDADITLRLHQYLYPKIKCDARLNFVYHHIEMPVLGILFEIERNGVLLDSSLLEMQSHELGEKLLILEQQAFLHAGQPFNLNSPKQIQEILFNQLKLPVIKKTPKGVPSTNEEVLQQLALDYPLPKILLDYRALAKLKSTYTDKLPLMVNETTGRVHTNYAQAVAVTGRLASNDPNLQNIPVRTAEGRRIREAFIASPGNKIISADYSQIELRIMAHISQDTGLLKAFSAGEDIHNATATEIFGVPLTAVNKEQRRYAKIINFGLIYGMSEFGLAAQLGIERSAARTYMDRYFARYPGVADYMEHAREHARQSGYVETVLGRRLWLPDINSANGHRRHSAERAAINAPMQGTAADIIKLAMIAVHNWLVRENMRSKLIMQVHDELVLEVPDAEIEVIKNGLPVYMSNAAKLDVPLLVEVGIGENWEQAH